MYVLCVLQAAASLNAEVYGVPIVTRFVSLYMLDVSVRVAKCNQHTGTASTVECHLQEEVQCVHKTAECRRLLCTHSQSVDSECVSIQWLGVRAFVCVSLCVCVCVFFFNFLTCGCLNFHLSVFVFTNWVHTHFTLSRVKTSPERNSGKERQKKSVLPLTANHRKETQTNSRERKSIVYISFFSEVHHLFCVYFVYI